MSNKEMTARPNKIPFSKKPHIIVCGSIVNGFKFYGPFRDWYYACAAANKDHYLGDAWWLAPLEQPPVGAQTNKGKKGDND